MTYHSVMGPCKITVVSCHAHLWYMYIYIYIYKECPIENVLYIMTYPTIHEHYSCIIPYLSKTNMEMENTKFASSWYYSRVQSIDS